MMLTQTCLVDNADAPPKMRKKCEKPKDKKRCKSFEDDDDKRQAHK
jgi:hypothetical protein